MSGEYVCQECPVDEPCEISIMDGDDFESFPNYCPLNGAITIWKKKLPPALATPATEPEQEPCRNCYWKVTAVDEEDLMALCHPCVHSSVHADNFKGVKDEQTK